MVSLYFWPIGILSFWDRHGVEGLLWNWTNKVRTRIRLTCQVSCISRKTNAFFINSRISGKTEFNASVKTSQSSHKLLWPSYGSFVTKIYHDQSSESMLGVRLVRAHLHILCFVMLRVKSFRWPIRCSFSDLCNYHTSELTMPIPTSLGIGLNCYITKLQL